VSRLVCDFNRDADAPAVIPEASDGHVIPATASMRRAARPGWRAFRSLSRRARSHSGGARTGADRFAPQLYPASGQRPCGRAALACRRALQRGRAGRADRDPLLEAEPGLCVGDQQPYSGRLLNATMNRHAEAHGRPYLGLEIRQDLIGEEAGQARWAARLARIIPQVMAGLAANR
jgi:predicted N-formylglutamate amidohydrolase